MGFPGPDGSPCLLWGASFAALTGITLSDAAWTDFLQPGRPVSLGPLEVPLGETVSPNREHRTLRIKLAPGDSPAARIAARRVADGGRMVLKATFSVETGYGQDATYHVEELTHTPVRWQVIGAPASSRRVFLNPDAP